jgi:thioredoxin 1
MVLELNDSNVNETLEKENGKVMLIDFHATWCGPCRMLSPTIDKLANENKDDNVLIIKMNVDESKEFASANGVRNIPALLFFKDGVVVDRMVGVQSYDTLNLKLNSLL